MNKYVLQRGIPLSLGRGVVHAELLFPSLLVSLVLALALRLERLAVLLLSRRDVFD